MEASARMHHHQHRHHHLLLPSTAPVLLLLLLLLLPSLLTCTSSPSPYAPSSPSSPSSSAASSSATATASSSSSAAAAAAASSSSSSSSSSEQEEEKVAAMAAIRGGAMVPAMFVFGDSLVDDGNNNFLPSLARSNFAPYGIDFPLGATGRFCNGRTVLDLVGQMLGLPFVPAYLNPSSHGEAILHGVNYASGAGGILDVSGRNYIARLSFGTQIGYFKDTLQELAVLLGPGPALADYLSKSLFGIVFGSNDYLNNYLINSTGFSSRFTPDEYRLYVAQAFSKQLLSLYELGARRFLIAGVGPLGCIPNQLATKSSDGNCVAYINELIQGFNAQIIQLVGELNADPQLKGATFLYGKVYEKFEDILQHPHSYGFTEAKSGCCGVGRFKGVLTCLPRISTLCPDREKHVFWDAFHPSEATNRIIARAVFHGGIDEIIPMNLLQLLQQAQS